MTKRIAIILWFLICLLYGGIAKATVWQSPSCGQTDVQNTINAGTTVTGDTVQVLGPCNLQWSSFVTIPNTKGIYIQGVSNPTFTSTSEGFILNVGTTSPGPRISGFTCNRAGNVPTDFNGHCFQVNTAPGNATYRIDHNTLCAGGGNCNTANTIFVTISGVGPGLWDHNTFTGNGSSFIQANGTGSNQTVTTEWTDDVVPGGSQMLFFEDNSFINASCVGVSGCASTSSGWIQGVGGTRTVIRHNTINMLNIDQHGSQNGGAECTGGGSACTGNVGVRWYEIYNNNFVITASGSWFSYMDLRAGSGVFFNNTLTGSNGSWGFVRIYEENTLAWPQAYQAGSGRGDITSPHTSCVGGTQNTTPIYLWTGTGSTVNTGANSPTSFNIKLDNGVSSTVGNVQLNRDLFVSSSQPGTLRKIEAAGDTCSTTYSYTPFTYPHPLIGGTVPAVAITAPSPGTISGTAVTITGTCSVTGGTISSVQFQIDGSNYGAAGSTSPYSPAALDTTTLSNANHTIGFSCIDSNNLQNSTNESVIVSNPNLVFAPSPLNFGNVVVGVTGPTQTVTISNVGTLSETISGIALSGGNVADFALTGGTCGGSLAASASCTKTATFTPSTTAAETTTMTVSGTATTNNTVVFNGTGTAVPVQPAPTPLVIISYSGNDMILTVTGAPKCMTLCTITLQCKNNCGPRFGAEIQ